MEALSVVINAVVVAAVGVALWWAFRGRFDAIEARIDRLEDRLDQRIGRVDASVEALRSDLTAVALAVGTRQQATGH